MKRLTQKRIPPLLYLLIACAGLNLLWYKRMMIAVDYSDRMIFVPFCGIGILVVALLLDRQRLRWDSRRVALFCCLGGAVFTLLALAPSGLHLIGLAGSGLFGGGGFLVLISKGMRLLPPRYRGRGFAFAFLFSGLVNTSTDIGELPALFVKGSAPNLFMACVALILCLGLVLWRGQAFNAQTIPIATEERSEARQMAQIGTVAILCFLLLYLSVSLKESVAYPSAITGVSTSGFIRFIEIPLWLIAAFVTDLVGRRILLGASLMCAFIGAAGTLATESANVTALATLCTYFCQIGFPTACIALLADVSFYMRRPALLGFFAFAPLILGQLLEGIAALLLQQPSNETLFLIDVLILAVFSGVAIWLFTLVSSNLAFFRATVDVIEVEGRTRGLATPEQIALDYDLTRREQEILVLIIADKTVRQMSADLCVSESTVKFHITNILKKTASTNRAAMLEKFGSG